MPSKKTQPSAADPLNLSRFAPRDYALVVLLALVLLTTTFIRFRLLSLPLERDEGEYAYAGQLILHGVPPYQLAYNMKFPGTYVSYAAIMALFGETPSGIHFGFFLVNLMTIGLVFCLGRLLIGAEGGLVAAASYGVLSLSPTVFGLAAHATHFVIFFALAGLVLILGRRRLVLTFLGGICLGLAVLMKQPGLFFLLFALGWLIYSFPKNRMSATAILLFLLGAVLPFALTILWLWSAGTLGNFWFWCFGYAREYGSLYGWRDGMVIFGETIPSVISICWSLWLLAIAGVIVAAKKSPQRLFLFSLFIASGLAVSLGFYFRRHYFVMLLPSLALFIGSFYQYLVHLRHSSGRWFALAAITLGLAFPVAVAAKYFFALSPTEVSTVTYSDPTFNEAKIAADYLRDHSETSDRVAVLGSEPEIYFYARRRSASGFIYMYPLLEVQKFAERMQDQAIAEIESIRPRFIVYVWTPYSWSGSESTGKLLLQWAGNYTGSNYRPVGLINMPSHGPVARYLPLAAQKMSVADRFILIFERK